jgi:hypothetical protein
MSFKSRTDLTVENGYPWKTQRWVIDQWEK